MKRDSNNDILNIMWCKKDDYKEPTVKEFNKEIAPLRKALKKEVSKTEVKILRDLTIRQVIGYWEITSRGRHWPESLDEIRSEFDLDAPEDLFEWSERQGHLFDLDYAKISFFPKCLNFFETVENNGKGAAWILVLMGHPGHPYNLARHSYLLQEAGVDFYLSSAKRVMSDFNEYYKTRKAYLESVEEGTEQ